MRQGHDWLLTTPSTYGKSLDNGLSDNSFSPSKTAAAHTRSGRFDYQLPQIRRRSAHLAPAVGEGLVIEARDRVRPRLAGQHQKDRLA